MATYGRPKLESIAPYCVRDPVVGFKKGRAKGGGKGNGGWRWEIFSKVPWTGD